METKYFFEEMTPYQLARTICLVCPPRRTVDGILGEWVEARVGRRVEWVYSNHNTYVKIVLTDGEDSAAIWASVGQFFCPEWIVEKDGSRQKAYLLSL